MLIQIHILQNYSPANLNRDDTGSPKDAYFGFTRRGRISSQCLKRSIRKSSIFEEAFKKSGLLADRTKSLPGLIETAIRDRTSDEKVIRNITTRMPEIGKKGAQVEEEAESNAEKVEMEEYQGVTRQLIFLSQDETNLMAERLLQIYQEQGESAFKRLPVDKLEKMLEHDLPRSVDIALFGRMTTSSAFEDVKAAAQVAHAISTNSLTQEFDYYTAVDDLTGQSGAGMIGDVEFNSSCYYKYFNIHWEGLLDNLSSDRAVARQAVLAFLEATAFAHPSGKQNSFAAFNPPEIILVEVSDRNLPVSYANAFLHPARSVYDKTLAEVSVNSLSDYMGRVQQVYGYDFDRAHTALGEYTLPGSQQIGSLKILKEWLAGKLPG